ncbi:MAG: hypothetical protein Q9173_001780 [Seirophora scorigena]
MAASEADDDGLPKLSADTLAALGEFYSEREQNEKRLENLRAQTEQQQPQLPLSMNMFMEDWNASQFWYSDETATLLAQQLLDGATVDTRIAVVSAPSVFVQCKNLLVRNAMNSVSQISGSKAPRITLFEFDRRFGVFAEFVRYDFQTPTKLPDGLKGTYDRVLCDPPFLSADCQTKAAITVRWLSKPRVAEMQGSEPQWIVCTGERMEGLVRRLYPGIKTTDFRPRHAQDRLSNDFRCYANFNAEAWKM